MRTTAVAVDEIARVSGVGSSSPREWDRVVPRMLSEQGIRMLASGIAVGETREDLSAHRLRWSRYAPAMTRLDLAEAVGQVGVTGRGGGHFPVARKWQSARAAGPGGTVVVNAAEGEPASAKDAVLWQCRPHLVLDGAVAIADVIGARDIIIWVHESATATMLSIEQALAERALQGVDSPPVRILCAPDAYVSGEASAVIAGVRGGAVAPIHVTDPARPWGEGPAILVHNTETVARVGALAVTGVEEYPHTSLITVARPHDRGGMYDRVVYELPSTCSVADALRRAGIHDAHAVLLGGFAGTWLPSEAFESVPLDPIQTSRLGVSLGAGIIIPVRDHAQVLSETTAIATALAGESAGQCGPCIFGLPALARSLKRTRFDETAELAALIEGRGGCRMPDGVVRMVRSALTLIDRPSR